MAGITNFGTINTCAGQKDAFKLVFQPAAGVNLAGAVVRCQIKTNAQPTPTPALTPTVSTQLVSGQLEAIFAWTAAQSQQSLRAPFGKYEETSTYLIEVDLALADDPTESVMRLVGLLAVAPGGIAS